MNIAIRILKWLGIIAFTLGAMFLLIIFNFDSLEHAYDKWTFEHPSSFEGIKIGDSKKDVIFKRGKPVVESERCNGKYCLVEPEFVYDENKNVQGIVLHGDFNSYGVSHTEELLWILGEPFILAETKDNMSRAYTYATGKNAGVTYGYKQNTLQFVLFGRVYWRGDDDELGAYYINGKQICPSEICPFDLGQEKTRLKEQWEDKTVWDFIDENDL
jgi:hypothetical protein